MSTQSLGRIWAVCDHFGKPVTAKVLKESCGVGRTQLRKWAREGRLIEYEVYDGKGQRQKAYSRPGKDEQQNEERKAAD